VVPPLAEKIEVTREEFNAEVAHLKELTEKYSRKWGRLRQLVANVTRWETNVANLTRTLEELKRRLPASWREYRYIRDVELPKAKERLADWTSQRETYIAEMRTELDEILAERERIARKIIKPPPPIPVIGVLDSVTGLKILLLNREREGSKVWLYDEEKDEYLQPVETVRVEYTASIETGGHESFIGELTGWTIIDGEELSGVEDIVDELMRKTEDWFYRKFAPPPTGEAFFGGPIPKEAIKPDFTIQEHEHEAKYEDGIQEYEMTVTGEIVKKMVMKTGIGFYANPDETSPKWRLVKVYVEYAHEDEALGVAHSPMEEIIDP
jgi:hypothetical protein